MTLFDFEELCAYWKKNPPTHWMVAAYLGFSEKPKQPSAPPSFPSIAPNATPDGPVTAEAAQMIFSTLGHAGSGMLDANVLEGMAVAEMPVSFDDLKRLNGL